MTEPQHFILIHAANGVYFASCQPCQWRSGDYFSFGGLGVKDEAKAAAAQHVRDAATVLRQERECRAFLAQPREQADLFWTVTA